MTRPLPLKTTRGPRKGEGGRPKKEATVRAGESFNFRVIPEEAKIISAKIEKAIKEGKATSKSDYLKKLALEKDL